MRVVGWRLAARLSEGTDRRRHSKDDGPQSAGRLEDQNRPRDPEEDSWAAEEVPPDRK